MYARLTRFHINADLASETFLGLRIIWIIIMPCINVWRPHVYAELAFSAYLGLELFIYFFFFIY